MEISGKGISLKSRKTFFQITRDLLRRKVNPAVVRPALADEYPKVTEDYAFQNNSKRVRKEKFAVFIRKNTIIRDKSMSHDGSVESSQHQEVSLNSAYLEEVEGIMSETDITLPCVLNNKFERIADDSDSEKVDADSFLYEAVDAISYMQDIDFHSGVTEKSFQEVYIKNEKKCLDESASASKAACQLKEKISLEPTEVLNKSRKFQNRPEIEELKRELSEDKWDCAMAVSDSNSQFGSQFCISNILAKTLKKRKVNQLSKAKKILKIENKLREILLEPEKLLVQRKGHLPLQLFLNSIEKCLLELSKNTVIWNDILVEVATMVQDIRENVSSLEHKLCLMDILHKKGLAKCSQVCGNEKPGSSLSYLQKELNETMVKYQETSRRNTHLEKQVTKLESLVHEQQMEIVDEKERRHKAESDLMMVTMEAGALRRKLNMFLHGGPEMDPHLLQTAFKKCREELGKRTCRLQEIELLYKNVVPKEELERFQKKYSTLSHTHEKLSCSFEQLKMKHNSLEEYYEAACQERDELRTENESLRRSATPRPEWNRVAEHIEGGINRWHEMSSGRTSDQLLEILLAELTGSSSVNSAEYLSCQGTDESVPAFLRYDGCVRNKRLGKRDVLLIIQDIWKERKKNKSSSLAEFIDTYFQERYHIDEVRAEWCYSLADACQRLAHEEQVGLFWGILCGQVQEEVYHHQEKSSEILFQMFSAKDVKNKGIISRLEAEQILKDNFHLKSEQAKQELISIVNRAASSRDPNIIKYRPLFIQDECKASSGIRLPLAKVLARQSREEQEEYVSEILKEIKSSAMDVSVCELRRAFTMIDPRIEQSQLDSYISWVFNTPRQGLQTCEPISLGLLVARLQTGLITRIGKKDGTLLD